MIALKTNFNQHAQKCNVDAEIQAPRKTVNWTPETVERMWTLIDTGYSQSQVATKLNAMFPQDDGVYFTKNAIIGKRLRLIEASRKLNQ